MLQAIKQQTGSILLDTHVILWAATGSAELKDSIRQIVEKAGTDNCLLISSISLWEIAMLKSKKRLHIYTPTEEFLNSLADTPGLQIVDITPTIAAKSTELLDDFHGDPADRLIAATAIVKGATLLTRDRQILRWASLGNIRAIEV